jgi:hypothetical protein
MQVVLKHLYVTAVPDNLEQPARQVLLVQRVRRAQRAQPVQQELVDLETEHDLVLVHLESVRVMTTLTLNSSTYLLADNSP